MNRVMIKNSHTESDVVQCRVAARKAGNSSRDQYGQLASRSEYAGNIIYHQCFLSRRISEAVETYRRFIFHPPYEKFISSKSALVLQLGTVANLPSRYGDGSSNTIVDDYFSQIKEVADQQ